ncbi:MAG: Ldh family oxidoreductase [Paracoccaceae bacterium]
MEPSPDAVAVALDEIDALVRRALHRHGADEANAGAVARTIAAAERDGAESHGLFRLAGYCASLDSGKANGRAAPVVTRPAPGAVDVDAGRGFAPLALEAGLPLLVDVARDQGVAVLAVRRCLHFAALWPEAEAIAAAGLVGFACTAATPMVAPAGAATPFYGTNPIAFAVPRPGKAPLAIDQASAAMARGDVMLAARAGRTVPEGVGLDAEGRPTTDPGAILDGAQLAFGGVKGASIALMVEMLAGAVAGGEFSDEAGAADNADGGPPIGAEFLLAIDPARFGRAEDWQARADAYLDRLLGLRGTRLPGARRHANRAVSLAAGEARVAAVTLETARRLAGG